MKTFLLRLKVAVPKGGRPFFVESTHPNDTDIRATTDPSKAKHFHDDYLRDTVWDWADKYVAIEL